MQVALDESNFFLRIHDLPLSMMNLGVSTLVGNRIGVFRDMETDYTGCSWGALLRIWVSLNIKNPLKRALKIQSLTGKELLVRFTYKYLPSFCYLCECLGHIDKYCEVLFEEDYHDSDNDTPYRPWLRAPIPMKGRNYVARPKRQSPSRCTSQSRPPSRTGAVVFGSFKVGKLVHPTVILGRTTYEARRAIRGRAR
ncbi:UNVERIFIED_CONTAM: hypothetical protein Sradi_6931900 [Sesamum radiatum]|uniref:Zinc knuckle CX2CX4HX4C domain-containing protein n=1 Tax=Sesamum radiatum TaxID=300843 RepID=A0AAW2JFX4_SESRA